MQPPPTSQISSPPFTTLILDIGDVLFTWSSTTATSISPKLLKRCMSSNVWYEYERGMLSQEECYRRISEMFPIAAQDFSAALDQAKASLTANDQLIAAVRDRKAQSNGALRIFAMSNISAPGFQVLRAKSADWSIFDKIFISGEIGEWKPHFGFYDHVLSRIGGDPKQTIFINDKFENVLQARCMGWHGIVFDNLSNVVCKLRNLLGDPVRRGWDYLMREAKQMHSTTDNRVVLEENFARLFILEVTGNRDLVHLIEEPRYWNFFSGKPKLTTENFPIDLDTTSLGFTVVEKDATIVSSVMDEMLEYVNADGIIEMYFDHDRPRVDPCVCVNILTLFHKYEREHQLPKCLTWVQQVLIQRAYVDGTRCYTAEDFLFLLTRLLSSSSSPDLDPLRPLLRERVQGRIGMIGGALVLAMRILTCHFAGIANQIDRDRLLTLQCEDGGWEIGWMYKFPGGIRVGNRGFTTALAIKAINVTSPRPVAAAPNTSGISSILSVE